MPRASTNTRNPATQGFIVVAVLWILAALATLASIYAVYVANSVTAHRLHDDRIQAQALMSAALDLTAYHLHAANEQSRPTYGTFAFRLGVARVATEFVSEAARIDLNSAPKELLTGLFLALGAQPGDAEFYAERILGWRAAAGEDNQETESYRVAGLPYGPRGGPFVHIGELSLVRGIPPKMVVQALPYLTVLSGEGRINILDAAPTTVAALPGMNPERLNAFLNQRAASRKDGQNMLALLPAAAQSMAMVEASKAFRVNVRAALENGRQIMATAVILVPVGEDEPYRVLSWADDTDGSVLYELPRPASQ